MNISILGRRGRLLCVYIELPHAVQQPGQAWHEAAYAAEKALNLPGNTSLGSERTVLSPLDEVTPRWRVWAVAPSKRPAPRPLSDWPAVLKEAQALTRPHHPGLDEALDSLCRSVEEGYLPPNAFFNPTPRQSDFSFGFSPFRLRPVDRPLFTYLDDEPSS